MYRNQVRQINAGLMLACILGLALSYYAYNVETAKEKDDSYVAICDINEHVSCTKVFMSEYGKGFGIIPKTSALYAPNAVYGLVFYTLVAVLSVFDRYPTCVATVALGIGAVLGSVYLAYVLYLLNDICVVCVAMYIVNATILTLAIKKYGKLFRNGTRQKKMK